MLKPKRPIFKNYAKTQCFCALFEYQLMSVKHNDDVTTMSKKHENIIARIIVFEQQIKNFRPRCWNAECRGLGQDLGLDFGGLGRVLGSSLAILRPWSDDLGAFGRRPWGFVPAMLRGRGRWWAVFGRNWTIWKTISGKLPGGGGL